MHSLCGHPCHFVIAIENNKGTVYPQGELTQPVNHALIRCPVACAVRATLSFSLFPGEFSMMKALVDEPQLSGLSNATVGSTEMKSPLST